VNGNLWYKSLIVSRTTRTLAAVCTLVGLAATVAAACVRHRLLFDPRDAPPFGTFFAVGASVAGDAILDWCLGLY
jgi:hypothetical protein